MSSEAISCRRCMSPFEDGDLRCAVCGHAAPADVRDDLAEAIVEVLRCEGCGAAVSYSGTARAPQCAFCGSIVHLEHPEDPLEQAGLVLPFTVDRSRAGESFRQWQGSLGWFRPADLRSESRLESLRALWWVGWAFDVDSLVRPEPPELSPHRRRNVELPVTLPGREYCKSCQPLSETPAPADDHTLTQFTPSAEA